MAKQSDPLANVKIPPPKTAADTQASAVEAIADAAAEAVKEEPAPVPDAQEKSELKAEKRKVRAPPTAKPAKLLPKYLVLTSQNVSWKGQQLRLKAQISTLSDAKQGPGAVAAFKAAGVKMKEVK